MDVRKSDEEKREHPLLIYETFMSTDFGDDFERVFDLYLGS
jgi:hypothetical protein